MRFFTPEVYVRFNSSDDMEADRANEEWEEAIRAYREHLDTLRDQVPEHVRKLASLCLHDAEILARQQTSEPIYPKAPIDWFPFWPHLLILSARQDDDVVSLIYLLGDKVREHGAAEDWPFSKDRTHWLYDEVDAVPGHAGMFVHRVLLSDGTVLEIPFISVFIHNVALKGNTENRETKRIA